MKSIDVMVVLGIVLCLLAGVIIGQSFSFEVKLSDLIALTATLITFAFAYFGLKFNNAQYINSITPIIRKYELNNPESYCYILNVHNYSAGAAIDFDVKISLGGIEYSLGAFMHELGVRHGAMSQAYGFPAVLAANGEHEILKLTAKDSVQFWGLQETLRQSELILRFSTIQHLELNERIKLGFK
ncbi:hypothetical protein [Pseudoalteromonas shioyasakiensis]|uniref:hypothetical protein n=1 Tax=Pseudoalteromonas shioyasakiensis TaxID=1190813 RepID=UPI001C3CBF00|nr:hypothetical protein [Pseudoalteromonas shioyasakiensis]